jgi:hypothetical protein
VAGWQLAVAEDASVLVLRCFFDANLNFYCSRQPVLFKNVTYSPYLLKIYSTLVLHSLQT